MPPIHDPEYWLAELRPLTDELQFAFQRAVPEALRYFNEFKQRKVNKPLLSNLIRYEVLNYLNAHGYNAKEEGDIAAAAPVDGCEMKGLPNNGIELTFRQSCIRIRKGQVPPNPTTNSTCDFYQQRLEFDDDGPIDVATNLLILWDLDSDHGFTGLRLVRPVDGGPKFAKWEWEARVPLFLGATTVTEHQYMHEHDLPMRPGAEAQDEEHESDKTGTE